MGAVWSLVIAQATPELTPWPVTMMSPSARVAGL